MKWFIYTRPWDEARAAARDDIKAWERATANDDFDDDARDMDVGDTEVGNAVTGTGTGTEQHRAAAAAAARRDRRQRCYLVSKPWLQRWTAW